MSRDSIEATRGPADDRDIRRVAVDNEDTYCTEVTLTDQSSCWEFLNGTCWQYSITDLKTRENALKDVIKASRKWGEPIRYFADGTEVSSIEQAVSLADPTAKVVFPSIDGVSMVWSLDTEPRDTNVEGSIEYTTTKRYVDLRYLSDVSFENYWR